MVLEWEDSIVLIDSGSQFPDPKFGGVDLLVPDFEYLVQNREKVLGVVVTHGHEDHIGSIPAMAHHFPVHVYSTAFPRGLIKQKLSEYPDAHQVTFHEELPGEPFKVGPFTFEYLPVQHSIIEAYGLGIQTPVGNIVHTGDFKGDEDESLPGAIPLEGFRKWAQKGVLLLMSDSTNSEVSGRTLSEQVVAESLAPYLEDQHGRLIITLFSSNIQRIQNILQIAKSQGKKVGLCGRSLHTYVSLAHEIGAIEIPEQTLVLMENIEDIPADQTIVLVTGSQAEPQSALCRAARGEHRDLKLSARDTVLMSSKFIPGNERNIAYMINDLCRMGVKVIFGKSLNIHASGHATSDELAQMIDLIKPKFFMPVHGEYRHLIAHSLVGEKAGISPKRILVVENGQSVELSEDKLERGDLTIEMNKGLITGGFYRSAAPEVFSKRGKFSRGGVVSVALVKKSNSRKLLVPPRVEAEGLLLRSGIDLDKEIERLERHLHKEFSKLLKEKDVTQAIRIEVRRFFKKIASYKPEVISHEIEV